MSRSLMRLGLATALMAPIAAVVVAANLQTETLTFPLTRSGAAIAARALGNAQGEVKITSMGPVEVMEVQVAGLPPNTDFDLFVIQLPNPPFGVSWYQGDIETDAQGRGSGRFIGRFNIETFAMAPGTGAAPVVHTQQPFPDMGTNPKFNPIHTYHLGLWFNDPGQAQQAGLPGTVTPFNGDHHAGVQVLSTRNFPDGDGPLRQIHL